MQQYSSYIVLVDDFNVQIEHEQVAFALYVGGKVWWKLHFAAVPRGSFDVQEDGAMGSFWICWMDVNVWGLLKLFCRMMLALVARIHVEG